jgi:hypothetical protein
LAEQVGSVAGSWVESAPSNWDRTWDRRLLGGNLPELLRLPACPAAGVNVRLPPEFVCSARRWDHPLARIQPDSTGFRDAQITPCPLR